MSSDRRSKRRAIRITGGVFGRLNVRLTLWFTAVFLLTSLAVFALTYANTFRTLRDDEQRRLRQMYLDYYLVSRHALSDLAGYQRLISEVQADIGQPGNPVLVRIAADGNQTLYVQYARAELQQEFSIATLEALPVDEDGFTALRSDSLTYGLELYTVHTQLPTRQIILQIATDTSERVKILRVLQRSYAFTLVILLGISAVGGLFFVSRTLSPLGSLTTTIGGIIDTGSLDSRIPPRNTGDDLDHLVGSFNTMLDRIQRLVVELRDALDSVAHDLRTPMTRFRAIAESALAGGPGVDAGGDPALMREALSDALEESEQILSMLNAMMDISEAESGAMRLNRESIDLGTLCRQAAEIYSVVADEKQMTIDIAFDELRAEVDEARMRQVIGNLLDNAIKYGSPGSTITAHGGTVHRGNRVESRLTVANRGQSIPQDEIPRIWDRLYRGQHDQGAQGLGLGLTLVKAIVEAHGGSAVAERPPDGETRFTISLPAA